MGEIDRSCLDVTPRARGARLGEPASTSARASGGRSPRHRRRRRERRAQPRHRGPGPGRVVPGGAPARGGARGRRARAPGAAAAAGLVEADLLDAAALRAAILAAAPARSSTSRPPPSCPTRGATPPGPWPRSPGRRRVVLDAARELGARVLVASSAEIFRGSGVSPQREDTPPHPVTPYGVAKLAAHGLVGTLRSAGLHACSVIAYNHESPRRPEHYVTRSLSRAAAAVSLGRERVRPDRQPRRAPRLDARGRRRARHGPRAAPRRARRLRPGRRDDADRPRVRRGGVRRRSASTPRPTCTSTRRSCASRRPRCSAATRRRRARSSAGRREISFDAARGRDGRGRRRSSERPEHGPIAHQAVGSPPMGGPWARSRSIAMPQGPPPSACSCCSSPACSAGPAP